MIHNTYAVLRDDPNINKVIGDDYMILEFRCPMDIEKYQLLLEMNLIAYVISGRKDWMTPGKVCHLSQGDSLFMRKGVYTTRQYFDVDHCIILFFMTDDFISNFIRENRGINMPETDTPIDDHMFPIDMDGCLESLFVSIYNYLKAGIDMPKNLIEIKFKELLFNIVLNQNNRKLAQFFTSLGHSGRAEMDDVMMKNFQHDLQMEEFAKLCGKSLSAFKREFKSVYRQTPGKWLTNRRLEYARTLLVTSDLNVNEVGFESGFRNSSHFNKLFKENYQITPKQFRMLQQTAELQDP
jgi:AraC-like DNA-binding protein